MTLEKNKKILVVEDDPDIRVMMEYILKDDYDVVLCEDGLSGLNSVRSERPDLILLDIYMPGISGLEVLRTVRAEPETANIPIILVTAGALKDEVSEGCVLGSNDCIFKPFDPEELMKRIEKLI